MDYKKFSKKDLLGMLELIQSSLTCKTEDDVLMLLEKVKEFVCAEKGICAIGDIDSVKLIKIINYDYPNEWKELYVAEELYNADPIIHYNDKHLESFLWSEALLKLPNKPYKKMMQMASEFGLKHGIASGNHDLGNNNGTIFSFSSPKNTFINYHKEVLNILSPHLHQALLRVSTAIKKLGTNLTRRETEVLKWMKEGKTNWEISSILDISERTVTFHVENIERKLDAVNKGHAIAIAMECGMLT